MYFHISNFSFNLLKIVLITAEYYDGNMTSPWGTKQFNLTLFNLPFLAYGKKNGVLCSVHKLLFLECDASGLCPWSHTHNETPAFLQPDLLPFSGKKAERQTA